MYDRNIPGCWQAFVVDNKGVGVAHERFGRLELISVRNLSEMSPRDLVIKRELSQVTLCTLHRGIMRRSILWAAVHKIEESYIYVC